MEKTQTIKTLSIERLTKRFAKGKLLFCDVSFDLPPCSKTILVGPNGAGKSLLFECLTSNSKPTAGEVRYGKIPVAKLSAKEYKALYSYQTQSPLFPAKSKVKEMVQLYHSFFSVQPRYKRLRELIESFENTYCEKLSGGEAKLLLLYLTLVSSSPVVVLDEPTSSLDKTTTDTVFSLLEQEERTLLFSSHRFKRGLKFCDQVLFLGKGQMIAFAPSRDREIIVSSSKVEEDSGSLKREKRRVLQINDTLYSFYSGQKETAPPSSSSWDLEKLLIFLMREVKGDEYV